MPILNLKEKKINFWESVTNDITNPFAPKNRVLVKFLIGIIFSYLLLIINKKNKDNKKITDQNSINNDNKTIFSRNLKNRIFKKISLKQNNINIKRNNSFFELESNENMQNLKRKIKRKSCHCKLCGDLSNFQKQFGNIEFRINNHIFQERKKKFKKIENKRVSTLSISNIVKTS